MYYVYVIKSQKDGKNYTGLTDCIERRLAEHNRGKKSTASTSHRGPFVLLHKEEFETRLEARKREKYLKSGVGREWLKKHIPV